MRSLYGSHPEKQPLFPGRVSLEAAREALELGQEFFADNPKVVRGWVTMR